MFLFIWEVLKTLGRGAVATGAEKSSAAPDMVGGSDHITRDRSAQQDSSTTPQDPSRGCRCSQVGCVSGQHSAMLHALLQFCSVGSIATLRPLFPLTATVTLTLRLRGGAASVNSCWRHRTRFPACASLPACSLFDRAVSVWAVAGRRAVCARDGASCPHSLAHELLLCVLCGCPVPLGCCFCCCMSASPDSFLDPDADLPSVVHRSGRAINTQPNMYRTQAEEDASKDGPRYQAVDAPGGSTSVGLGVHSDGAAPHTQPPPAHMYGSWVGYCFTVNYILGVGVLGMPWAFYKGTKPMLRPCMHRPDPVASRAHPTVALCPPVPLCAQAAGFCPRCVWRW